MIRLKPGRDQIWQSDLSLNRYPPSSRPFRANGEAMSGRVRALQRDLIPNGDAMRQKIFGMVGTPLDRNAKAKLLHRARCLMRPVEKGKHYGPISAKTYAVFCALLMSFHNGASGRCFPSYARLEEAAGCCRATVAAALQALEASGLLTVLNRLVRVRWKDEAALAVRTRVMRTSNCYAFPLGEAAKGQAPPSKFKLQGGTGTQVFNSDLFAALNRLQRGIGRRSAATY
jgi:Helix-turn-helix domain